ncbi:MAG: FG-GAP-like repeat-containing protein, partial [Planctomycetota bacterium]
IAKAKVLFDRGEYAAAEELLQEIILASPEFLPAQLLLGRLLVDRGSFQDLAEWSRSLPPDHQKSWTYWMVLGDWARNAGDVPGAARAYWESTRRNPDVVQVWAKLASVLNQLPKEAALELDVDLASIQRRANLLSAFYAQKDRFERSNRKSKRVVYEIVSTLRQLGRLWEAEAWAALGMTIAKPSEESPSGESLNALRASIVPSLRRDTPWHLADGIDSSAGGIEGFSIPVFESSKDNPSVEADLASGPSSEIQLENRATSLGLTFFGRTRDDLDQAGIPIYAELGCGGGAIDFDLDGWPDVYLMDAGGTPPTRDSRSNALFRNTSGRFTNVVSPSRTADFGFGQGVTVGDVNADGFPDLLLLNYGTNTLLINQGDGTFVRSSDETLRSHSAWSTSGAIADLDGDGLPEVIVLQYCAGTNPVTELCTDAATGITKSCAPIHFPADGDRVLDQTGMGVLKDVTERWSFEPEIAGRGLGLLVGDLDGKTGLDVLVANDMTNNHFYSFGAPSSDRFSESGMLRGLACDDRSNPQASMGIAAGDLDRDGDLDFFVTNFENEYNTLYEQRAIGTWQDRTAKKGLAESTLPQLGFGTEAVDLDHDGSLELVVSNGHVNVPVDDEDSDYTQPMQIFRRSASQRFGPATVNGSSYLATKHVGRSLWTLDANRDGRMDLAVTHQTEPVALLINQTESPHHWIELHLRGVHCGRDAIGAKVNVRAGSQEAYATLLTGDGFQCSNQRVLNIGLGASTLKVVIDITWPDGTEESYSSLDIDTRWMLIQGQGVHRLD